MRKKVAKPAKAKMQKMKMAKGGGVKVPGTGCATKGTKARGPMA